MTAVARITVLHLRTVAPYRTQGLLVFGLLMLILARNPDHVVPALAVLLAPLIAVQPFVVADKADLGTLYAVLPAPRRTVPLRHYAWAVESFLAIALAGTAVSALLARAEGPPFGGRDLMTMVMLVLLAVYRLHLTITSIESWLPLLWAAGAAAIATSALLAAHASRPRG
jgi:hypothetical protein